MDEQNRGGQPPQQGGGWSNVGQGGQYPSQGSQPGQPGTYGTPTGAPAAYPPASGYGQPPAAPAYPPAPGYPPQSGTGYPPPPPAGYPPQQAPYGQQPPYGQPPAPYGQPAAGTGMPANTAAAVAYLTVIPAIIFLVMDPYKRMNFVRFHAWQCLVLSGASIVFFVGLSIVSFIFAMIHLGIISILLSIVYWIMMLVFFVFWLIAIIKASKGERYHVPLIGGFAEKFTGTM